MPANPSDFDATAQAELVHNRDVTPLELVDEAISRVELRNPAINAVVLERFDKARAEASSPDLPDGPFRGVPILMKDLGSTLAGEPQHCGTRLFARTIDYAPAEDGYVTRKLRRAGFVVIGKTNTPELGLSATTEPIVYGATRNPWDLRRSSGGSSGGSAAAVASGMVAVAHASDGGGSIRIPASACGLVGLKPSRARVSLGPAYGEGWHGLLTEGAETRTVRDAAAVLDVLAGPMPGDPYAAPTPERPFREEVGRDPGRLRIGSWCEIPGRAEPLHPDCAAAVAKAAKSLALLGHHVEESHPAALDEAESGRHFDTLVYSHSAATLEALRALAKEPLRGDDLERCTWDLANEGARIPVFQYLAAIAWLQSWSRRIAAWWADGFDLLLTPTLPAPPPFLGEMTSGRERAAQWKATTRRIPFTVPFNVTGQPAVSLPLAWTADGVPIGVQLVAAYGREDLLIRVAAQLELEHRWQDRRPAGAV